jgi:hypothetical protein
MNYKNREPVQPTKERLRVVDVPGWVTREQIDATPQNLSASELYRRWGRPDKTVGTQAIWRVVGTSNGIEAARRTIYLIDEKNNRASGRREEGGIGTGK